MSDSTAQARVLMLALVALVLPGVTRDQTAKYRVGVLRY